MEKDYEIKFKRNTNKINRFMEDKGINYQDLTLELIEEFILQVEELKQGEVTVK